MSKGKYLIHIKMTGMRAFGSTHRREEIPGNVAFLGRLPLSKVEEDLAMVKRAEPEEQNHRHHSR